MQQYCYWHCEEFTERAYWLHWQERKLGQRLNIIVLSEGAVDSEGNLITAESVKEVRMRMQTYSRFLWYFFLTMYATRNCLH